MKTKECTKVKFDKIGAMLALAKALNQKKRLEQRYYYCNECKAYHLTKHNTKTNFCKGNISGYRENI